MERIETPTDLVGVVSGLRHHNGELVVTLLVPYQSERSSNQYWRRLQALLKRYDIGGSGWRPLGEGVASFFFDTDRPVSPDIFKALLHSHPALREMRVELSLFVPPSCRAREPRRRGVQSSRKAGRSRHTKDAT
jgi:hypothetical protein